MSANATSLSLSNVTSSPMSASSRAQARGVSAGRYALVGLATVFAAVLANTLFYYIGGALVAYDPGFVVLASPGGTIIMTVFPAIVAVLLYGGLLRFTRNAARVFSIVSAIVFVVTLVPDFTYIPTVPGSSAPQTTILVLMHVIAASVIVRMLTSATRSQS